MGMDLVSCFSRIIGMFRYVYKYFTWDNSYILALNVLVVNTNKINTQAFHMNLNAGQL